MLKEKTVITPQFEQIREALSPFVVGTLTARDKLEFIDDYFHTLIIKRSGPSISISIIDNAHDSATVVFFSSKEQKGGIAK